MKSVGEQVCLSVGLSALFLAVYGGAMGLAASRAGPIPSFYFGWERHVPFVALAIVPYLSIDLFFVAAPFLLRTDHELRAHAGRVVLALLTAGVFFVLTPLKFAFTRPPVPGPVGFVFDQFRRADLPFNQLPSLHVALLLIVADAFARRVRRGPRLMLFAWFALIAASPLLVFQHHVTDVLAGFALGLVCLTLFPFDVERTRFERNWRVGACYLIGFAALLATCVLLGRNGWPLWWPTLSLVCVTVGYAFIGPALYAKRGGRLPLSTKLLLWPTLLGQHVSLRWYARRCSPHNVLIPGRLWIGRQLSAVEAATAIRGGVTAVVDLTCEFSEPLVFRGLPYLNPATLDLTAPSPAQVDRAVAFIRQHAEKGIVYLHCKVGYSRTAVVAAAYLLASGRADSVDAAINLLRSARPTIIVRSEARQAIDRFDTNIRAARPSRVDKSLTAR